MRLKLQLPAKAGRFHIFECEAVRLVTLPDKEFQDFLNGPHQDGRWAAEPFYADEHGRRIYQGVLVLGEEHKDGVFAYDGGKHFAYLPGARAVVDSILEQAVEKIIREGAENTNEGIRTQAEKKEVASAWLELAISCAKVPVKYEADEIKRRQKEEKTQREAEPVMA